MVGILGSLQAQIQIPDIPCLVIYIYIYHYIFTLGCRSKYLLKRYLDPPNLHNSVSNHLLRRCLDPYVVDC